MALRIGTPLSRFGPQRHLRSRRDGPTMAGALSSRDERQRACSRRPVRCDPDGSRFGRARLSRSNDLRHRSSQPRHGLDRIRDRLRRAQGSSQPAQRVRPGAARRPQQSEPLSARPRRRGAHAPAPHRAAGARRHAGGTPDRLSTREPIRQVGLAMARRELELVPVVDYDGRRVGVMTERTLARRYIRESARGHERRRRRRDRQGDHRAARCELVRVDAGLELTEGRVVAVGQLRHEPHGHALHAVPCAHGRRAGDRAPR
jgi:hypothetical protein